ncbi:MAG: sensor histidine kinase [Acidimicrobiales bacterium]
MRKTFAPGLVESSSDPHKRSATATPRATPNLPDGLNIACPGWIATRPWLGDTLLALIVGGLSAAMVTNLRASLDESVLASPSGVPDWIVLLGPVLFVPIRRVASTVAVIGGGLAQVLTWLNNMPDNYIAMALLLYSAAAAGSDRSRKAAWTTALALSAFTFLGVVTGDAPFYAAPLVTLMSVAAVAIGTSMTRRHAYFQAIEARAADAERSRLAERDRALSEERNRIARELHDVVAHGLSVVVVQAAAAQRTLDHDPGTTREALERIEETGRTALGEMRHVLSVIRTDPDESWRPVPGLAGLGELIADMANTGLDVTLIERHSDDSDTAPARQLPATVDLTAYRIVQESLTNVLKHGGRYAAATVEIVHAPDSLDLSITDDGYGASSVDRGGHGLRGMQERVEVFGGDFSAGPRRGGGFIVKARLPLGNSPAAATDSPSDSEPVVLT